MAVHAQRPFIQGLINGHPATLIVDTGAVTSMIESDVVDVNARPPTISLQIGELRFPRLGVIRANVRSYAETYLGATADGIIGRDLLARYPVELDFPNHTLTIFRDSRSAASAQPPGSAPFALHVIGGLPAVAGLLDTEPALWFALATGASYEVQLEPSADHGSRYKHAEHSLVFHESTPTDEVSGLLVRAHALTVGSLTFNQPLVALLDVHRSIAPTELAGSLGAEMLSRVSLLIDEPSGSAMIVAPAGATSAQLYDPSGIALMMRRGTIVVRDVIAGTPADDAHIRPGDEIISINNLVPATLEFARQLLDGNPGQKVVVVFRRWHITHSATLPLRVII
jgi:PDZ domain